MTKLLDTLKLPYDIKMLSLEELEQLCSEIRQELISVVINNGGHLASNLGIVEITVALYYVFDFANDKIIFDVSHQSYVHKILSGRLKEFKTLRQYKGMSGFTNPKESDYDCFVSGHSSTAISLGCGFARADKIRNNNLTRSIVSIVGDGSLTGGQCYEAFNEVSVINGKQVLIINDNNMSINSNVGSTSSYLKKLRISKKYLKAKSSIGKLIDGFKVNGNRMTLAIQKIKNSIKYLINGRLPFDQYGVPYYGPLDGHNLNELITFLHYAKQSDKPIILHALTTKGKGYEPSESRPDEYHGINGKCSCGQPNHISLSKVFGETILELAKQDKDIVVTTAAMASGTGLSDFQAELPNNFVDVGIAEEHAVTMCSAMAKDGLKPYFAVYSTFLQRGFDQVIHDTAIMSNAVRFIIDRAGITGEDGETHQGIFDLSYLNIVPNMTIMSPRSAEDLVEMLKFSVTFNNPLAIRYPKCAYINSQLPTPIVYGKWEILRPISDCDIVILACGVDMVEHSSNAIIECGYNIGLVSCRFIKPLDNELLDSIVGKKIIVIEDNIIMGGLGSSILNYYNQNAKVVDIKLMGIKDTFVVHGSRTQLYERYNLDKQSILNTIQSYAIR